MAVKKLTLSAPEEVITEAKRLAKKKTTSVSALFTRLIRTVDTDFDPKDSLGPTTLRISGIVKLSSDRTDQELLEEALDDKYGFQQ